MSAATILSETFDTYSTPTGTNIEVYGTGSFLGAGEVVSGSIDLLSNFGNGDGTTLACYSGLNCVDMDGSTMAAGTLSYNFSYVADAVYTIIFYWAGNGRSGSDSMSVTLDGLTIVDLVDVPWDSPWTGEIGVFSPSTSGVATLAFAHAGGDNVGILLDDISIESEGGDPFHGEVPEPGTLALLAGGLALAGLLRRRKA
jgi:hypothetical protein